MKLHLTHDNVFIDNIVSACKELKLLEEHKFIVFPNDDTDVIKYTKSVEVITCVYNSERFLDSIGDWNQYSTVYIHWLWDRTQQLVLQIPKEVKVVWCFWGGDGLEVPELMNFVFQPQTARYITLNKKIKPLFTFSYQKLRQHLYKNYKHAGSFFKQHKKAVQRVNYFAHYLPYDFELINKANDSSMELVPFHYACIEDLMDFSSPVRVPQGNHIILGNSDTETNNHIEAIDILSKSNLQGYKIYCPLSYEGKKYAHDMAALGKKKLGSNFVPLLEFLPKSEYEKILSVAKVAIMNHNRSQALGNLAILLCNGTKVYMSEKSALYKFFKSNKVVIYSLQMDFQNANSATLDPLSLNEIEHNRKMMLELFGRDRYMEKLVNLFKL